MENSSIHAPRRPLAPEHMLADKYRILKPLGTDGSAIEYLGHNTRLDIGVTVKEYFPEGLAVRDPVSARVAVRDDEAETLFREGLQRFLEDAQALARRGSAPGAVTVMDFFRENGTAYIVTDARTVSPEVYAPQAEAEPARPQNTAPRRLPGWAFLLGGVALAAALLLLLLPRGEKTPAPVSEASPSPSHKAAFAPRTPAPTQEATPVLTPTPASAPTPGATERVLTRAELAQTNRFTVACGNRHVAYIRPDGTFGGVGSDLYGQRSGAGGTGVIRGLAAGYAHTVLLFEDGTVRATEILSPSGEEPYDYGQSDVAAWKNCIQIEAGWVHTVALLGDGTVLAAGDNAHGQCDVSAWHDVTEVAAGGWNTAALTADGRVLVAGDNEYGQCDIDWANESIVHIAVGRQFVVGLRADGTVIAAGRNLQNQLEVSAWRNIAMIAVGDYHTIGLTEDGRVKSTSFTGANAYGQDLTGDWKDVIAVYGGARSTVGLCADGTLLAAGLVDADTYTQTGIMPEKAAVFVPWWVRMQ